MNDEIQIEIVHSNLEYRQVFSEEDPDYRSLTSELRLLEGPGVRNLEDENKRLLE